MDKWLGRYSRPQVPVRAKGHKSRRNPRNRDNLLPRILRSRRIAMRNAGLVLVLACTMAPSLAQEEGPSNEKAQKTYKEAMGFLHKGMIEPALGEFKKAD